MPKITQISVQSNNKERCNIFIDGEFRLGLDIETVMLNRLKVGMELDDFQLAKLINEGERKEALNKGVSYVSKNLKTKKQVVTYLSNKGYSDETVYFVVDKLKEYNYINDIEYAKRYVETCSKTQGKRLVEFKLMSKGLKKEDIQTAYNEIQVPSKTNAYDLAVKYMKNRELTKENLAKAYCYLASRGFSYDEIDEAISNLKENFE